PVTTLAASQRGRSFAAGYENGHIRLMHVTSGKIMADVVVPGETSVSLITMAGKDDGLLAFSAGSMVRWAVDPRYPEATAQAIFGKVWYEGYAEPMYVWQSSSGTDDFEPKYGLIPLIFGSVKATFYSMLFALPIALLAAIYTSEFLHPRTKALFKPTIELMASLPSVVLGFMAALVFASWVEEYVPAVLSLFVTIPISFIFSAYLFQLLPEQMYLRLLKYRFIFILMVMPIGFLSAFWIGPLAERLFFAGDIMLWLDGQIGNGTGGWMFLMLPLCSIGVLYCLSRWVNPWIRVQSAGWSRSKMATFDLIRFICACAAAFGAAWAVSGMLTMIGWDPRGAYIDTYVQRNAMIVGFVMGFAVIPIIYTIAEDALSSVPSHLRSASLGCGATQWQTAVYVIIPTAMSGLFSAIMIGLGRAVGETMIVLMAAGNTPMLDWNMFNGFRTLSANIAVELPEAVRDSTHYRMLFLAALSLFVMTFVLNTLAEMIRLRFRKRTYEL
ncbi:ABC transporter permease subunit, partial [bacterium]|nr:ABC transporter permease subunit [bacterium]